MCNNSWIYELLQRNHIWFIIGSIVFLLIVGISLFLFFYSRKKKNKIVFLIGIISIIIILIIPIILYFIQQKENDCIEPEEREIPTKVEVKKPKFVEKEIEIPQEETIEIVEETPNDEESLELMTQENAFYFLNLGPSTEAFIIQDQGKFGLIDTGYNSNAKFILTQLKKLGAKELDFIIVTHAHLDHMGGYSKIMSSIDVKTLYIKNPGNVNSNYVPTYLSMIKQADEKGTAICEVKDKVCQSFDLGNIHFDLYNTDFINAKGVDGEDRSRIENANSITTVASINHRRIYFASDIGNYFEKNQEEITAKEVGDIDVYKVAHHGYVSYNNSLIALSYLKPEYNIMTNPKELTKTALNRIRNTSPDYKKTYYTTNGTVILHINMDGTMEFTQ